LVREKLGRLSGALEDLDRVISLESENPVAYYNRAIVRTTTGDYRGALEDYDRVASLSPDNVVVWFNRAVLKSRLGDLRGAAADYSRSIELYPDFAAAYMGRSEMRFLLKDLRGSRADRAAGERKIAEYRSRLTDSLFADYADEEQNFTRLLSFETRFTGSNFDRLASSRENLALLPLFRFTLHTPDTTRVVGPAEYFDPGLEGFRAGLEMPLLVFSRLESDIPTDSVMVLDRRLAAQISGGDDGWVALFKRGVTQSLIKQFTGSVGTLTRAIDANPTNAYLYINRSTTRAEMIDFISSIDGGYGRLTIDGEPEYRPHGGQGGSYGSPNSRMYNYDEAIADLNAAAKLAPDLAHVYYNRAGLLVMSGKLPEAFEDYTRAIELNPHFAEAYYNRGLVQIYMKDTRKGYLDISKAGELGITQAYDLIEKYKP
jgi:tetratricopeptide (TPR) repeat protein